MTAFYTPEQKSFIERISARVVESYGGLRASELHQTLNEYGDDYVPKELFCRTVPATENNVYEQKLQVYPGICWRYSSEYANSHREASYIYGTPEDTTGLPAWAQAHVR